MSYTVKSKQDLDGIATLSNDLIALDNIYGTFGKTNNKRK